MINLDWTLILQFINFFILMAALNALLYRPLRALLQRRKETVDGAYLRAKELEEKIDEKMARYQEQLRAAKDKGAQEKLALRQAALKDEAEILQAAHTAASSKLDGIRKQVAVEAEAASVALKSEVEQLAGLVAGKVLGRSM